MEVFDNFISEYNKIEILINNKSEALSNIDKELSDFYHKVEGKEISHVSVSHNLMKELKTILERRRQIKYEFMVLSAFQDLAQSQIKKSFVSYERIKKQHTKVLEEITNAGKKV
jgi:hypothetical protein